MAMAGYWSGDVPVVRGRNALVGAMGALVATLAVVVGIQWAVILTPTPGPVADRVCPAKTARVRYPESLADFKDSKGAYRVAYCKPTGVMWAGMR